MAKILVALYTYPKANAAYSCKILSDKRLLADLANYPQSGRSVVTVETIGAADGGRHVYVRPPVGCKAAPLDASVLAMFGLDLSAIGDGRYWIVDDNAVVTLGPTASAPKSAPKTSGPMCQCAGCGDVNPWAEPNMTDGTFRCYSCRQDPFRSVFRSLG